MIFEARIGDEEGPDGDFSSEATLCNLYTLHVDSVRTCTVGDAVGDAVCHPRLLYTTNPTLADIDSTETIVSRTAVVRTYSSQ